MNAITKFHEMKGPLAALRADGYDARTLQDGTIEVSDPVRTTHGIVYKNVDLKTPRDVYKFLMDRS